MHDKNYNGSIDLDECVTLLYARFGKARRMPPSASSPIAYRLSPIIVEVLTLATRATLVLHQCYTPVLY